MSCKLIKKLMFQHEDDIILFVKATSKSVKKHSQALDLFGAEMSWKINYHKS